MPAKKPIGYRLQMKLVKLYKRENDHRFSRESVYCNKRIEVGNISAEATDMFNRFMHKILNPEVLNT